MNDTEKEQVTFSLPKWLVDRIKQIGETSGVDQDTVVRNALMQEIFPVGKHLAALIALFVIACVGVSAEELEVKGENTAVEAPKKVNYQTPPGTVTTVGDGTVWSSGSGGTVVLTTNPMQVKPQNPTGEMVGDGSGTITTKTIGKNTQILTIDKDGKPQWTTPAKPIKKPTRNCAKRG